MFSQYEVPEWEAQLQGLIARNSALRDPGTITESRCRYPRPYPYPHPHPNIIAPAEQKPSSQSSQERADRSLSLVKEQIKKQGNVLDIVRGQLATFSNEFKSNRLAVEGLGAQVSSQGRLLKSLQNEENAKTMRLKALASDSSIHRRKQGETNDSTANLVRQMQQELSDLRADVKVLRDENVRIKEELDAVGVNVAESNSLSTSMPSSPCPSLSDRIKRIVAAVVRSLETKQATVQSIQELESVTREQKAVTSRDMDDLENRLSSAMNNALESVNNEIIHLTAKSNGGPNVASAKLKYEIQNVLCDKIDDLYVRRDEVQNMIEKEKASRERCCVAEEDYFTTGERICRLERRQNILEEQLYEQSSSTTSLDNNLLLGDVQPKSTEIPCENISDSSASKSLVQSQANRHLNSIFPNVPTTDVASLSTAGKDEHASRDQGAIQQAPEWVHSAVIEELKSKFTQ